MTLAESSDDTNDTAFDVEGIKFLVNRNEAPYLHDATVDFRKTWSGEGFIVQGPSAC
jgi:Fe-S cluster assembly iron-binding protein IscA